MSTALLGLVECKSGNRGPNGSGEVLLVIGLSGLEKAVNLGFMYHASCLANEEASVQKILDKAEFDWFDVNRVEWEKIINITGEVPQRIYLPHKWRSSKHSKSIIAFIRRFEILDKNLNCGIPKFGWYDKSVEGRFAIYS